MSPEGKKPKPVRRKVAGIGDNSPAEGYLDGQLLIAMPVMGDPRFERSVIYMCAHSSEGAMGIIVNHPAAHITCSDLLVQLNVIPAADTIQLPPRAEGAAGTERPRSAAASRCAPAPRCSRAARPPSRPC